MYLIDFDFPEELNFKSTDFEQALISNNEEIYKTLKDSKSVERWFSSYGTGYGASQLYQRNKLTNSQQKLLSGKLMIQVEVVIKTDKNNKCDQ